MVISKLENEKLLNDTVTLKNFDGLHPKQLKHFLSQHLTNFPNKTLEISQFSTGLSNLTYLIRSGEWEAVLRRPPLGELPPKAHDMKRESEFLAKIHPFFNLVPKPYIFCDDKEVIGAPFYVMERKHGIVLDDSFPEGIEVTDKLCKQISHSTVDALAQLHSVDYEEANLSGFGYPDGFLNRQVNGMIKRYRYYQTDDISCFEPLAKWFLENIPTPEYTSIIHNDYKLNNMLFSEDCTTIQAILDWEISTVADPFFDLGTALGYWLEEGDPNYLKESLPSISAMPGFIKREEFLHRYSLKTGKDIPNMSFYMAITYFKFAVVLQQIYYRWRTGQNKDERFEGLRDKIKNLMYHSFEITKNKKFIV